MKNEKRRRHLLSGANERVIADAYFEHSSSGNVTRTVVAC